MIAFYLTVFYLLKGVICQNTSSPLVQLPLGTLEGFIKKTVSGKEFNAFEGVPYATPPVGDFRFQEPVRPRPWSGIWKANTIMRCMQYDQFFSPGEYRVVGDEDCLYLNIYTPNLNTTKKMNVLVYIHGGGFMFGYGGLYGPDIILDRDLVYININYRLGPLGFLSTESALVPGNNGIRDQIQALKWIKENVKYFGGNPDSITIMGMSAGGASVQTHLMISQSKGLFTKGISQSGCVLNPWVLMEKALNKSKKLSSLVGCPTKHNEEMIKCLKTKPARQIVSTVQSFQPWLYNPFSPFGLVVDSWADDPIFPEHPLLLLRKGQVANLPWLISYTTAEGLYPAADFYNDEFLDYLDKNFNAVIPYILHYNDVLPPLEFNKVSSEIRFEYLRQDKITKRKFSNFVKILTDRLYLKDIETAARLHAAAIESPVYCYSFNYRGAHSLSESRSNSTDNIGVAHSDDTAYVLKMFYDPLSTEDDRLMSKKFVGMITSFMDAGVPYINEEWLPLFKNKSDPWVQLRIDNPHKIFLEEKKDIGKKNFWNSLPFAENENLFPLKDDL